ncbi:MAG: ATP-dependent dethiobiotin synthetase BioD [Phycisphaerae bacterium]|nr:ATP-dependent dethiobiotin synthetase BioD [Phycisphaerae bacterium]
MSKRANPLMGRFEPAAAGVFVTAIDTEVGKTVIAGALAMAARRGGRRVGVFKPFATGCRHRQGLGLVSSDSEFLAWAADCELDLATITPQRWHAPLAPMAAAKAENRPVDFDAVVSAWRRLRAASDFAVVEGIGGILVPLTRDASVLDLAEAMGLPAVVVARPLLGTLNHTLLTVDALRSRGLKVAAVAINRYNPDSHDPAEESNPAVLAELTRLPIVCVPDDAQTRVEPAPAIGGSVLFPCQNELLPLLLKEVP